MDLSQRVSELLDGHTWASTPVLSPDGSQVAYVVSTTDLDKNTTIRRIWIDDAPATAGPSDSSPQWSPDGKSLAFVSRRGERDSDATLHLLPVSTPGEVRTIGALPDGIDDVAWSPDGRWIGFTSRTRDERYEAKDESWQSPRKIERFFTRLNGEDWVFDRPSHVYVVAADGTGRPRNLTPGPFQHHGVSWLADSTAIVTSAQRHETWDRDLATDLYVVPLDGEIRALTRQTGDYGVASVSPDGTQIAFVGFDDPLTSGQNYKVGVISAEGGDHRWISLGLDRSFYSYGGMRPPVWLDEARLLALAEDRGTVHVFELHTDGREPAPITSGPVTIAGFDAAGDTVVTARSTVEHASEIHLGTGGEIRQLTAVARTGLDWERFVVPCSDDSGEIDAWIMRPAQARTGTDESARYPVLLNVHGGPFTQYGEQYFDEAQMQAAAGFVVLMCNPRGGSGRDTAWGQAILGPKHPTAPGAGWGSVDVDDILAVLDHALANYPLCDPERVGMLGGSYGGYMATLLAARHGQRFRAICSERAVNNLLTEEWSSDVGSAFRVEHGPDPVRDPEEYLRMSPSMWAEDIHVPMLLIHSENDWRCPISQTEELWMKLRLLDREVTFYRFPGEDHELSRSGSPVHRRMRAEIILEFFSSHLGAVQ